MYNNTKIAIVIPSYKVRKHILQVIETIDEAYDFIYVVDDCCPEKSGQFVIDNCPDNRVKVIYNLKNKGVGGAVLHGYLQAINDGADIIVKLDGDGQMNPKLIPLLIEPIINGNADYTKGNRFYDMRYITRMPKKRLFGNLALSFMTKFSTGYWNIFDPTNGFTAIHSKIAQKLPFDKISERYFFETDMLFRLNTFRAKVMDLPMDAVYGNEESNLKIYKIFGEFLFKHNKNFCKRIFYNYFLRDFSIAALELIFGILLFLFGSFFGAYQWIHHLKLGIVTPTGTVMLSMLPIIIGLQLLLSFLSYDFASTPSQTQHKFL